ncbi:MAG: hypothetical protein ABW298_17035 [Candidatus Binatia bacterium]
MPEADANSPAAPPGGPLPDDLRDAIHGLTRHAREEDRRAEEARKRGAKRPFSRFVKIGLALIVAQSALLTVLYVNQEKTAVSRQEIKSIVPPNSCSALVNTAYWKVVAYLREEGHPPPRLDDLVPKYLERVPLDPVTGKALSYSTDGSRFQVSCPEIDAPR